MSTVFDQLLRHAHERPAASAFSIHRDGALSELTFGALLADVRAFAHALAAHGVGAGDPVALALTTSRELVALVFAVQSLRAVPMIVSPSLPAPALARRVAQVQAKLLIDEALAATLKASDAHRHEPAAWAKRPTGADLAFLQLTSGTSGDSRAAAISHRALAVYLGWEGSGARLALSDRDVLVSWLPLHHDLGLVRFLFMPIWYAQHTHLLPPVIASLGLWLRTITATRATVTSAPDFAYRLAARAVPPEGIDLASLRLATNGGEPVRASSIAAFEQRFGCPGVVRPGYGLAEATLGVAATVPGEVLRVDARGHVGCGKVVPALELRVMRDGSEQAAGEVGDLEVRGSHLFEGYYDPTLPGHYDRGTFTADGWLHTGDTGYVDGDGVVFALGRTRAMVKQAGALIAPREVEEVVDRIIGVRLSAAVGLPNENTQAEELVVVVETRTEPAPEGLAAAVQAAVRAEVGVVPGRVLLVPARTIPLTANGKLRHSVLREQLLTSSST